MPKLYRPDGPTANKVRGLINGAGKTEARELAMALAHEIDRLREALTAEIKHLQDQIDEHAHSKRFI